MKEVDLNNNNKDELYNLSLNDINHYFNLNINKFEDIKFLDVDKNGYIMFIFNDINKLFLINDTIKYIINLSGIFKFTNDLEFYDWRIINKNLYILTKDKFNLYIQKYNLMTNKLNFELISNLGDENLITTKFFEILDNKIDLINRWESKRWVKEYIKLTNIF